jgi:SRSO17 transposase
MGKPPPKQRVLSGDLRKVSDIAKSDDISWQTVYLGEGAKGPLLAHVACMRVYPSRNSFPKKEPVWLFIRKHFDGQIRYAFSNAPADTSFEELCKASAMRWPVEQCFEEGKSHLGMDAYEHVPGRPGTGI